MTKEEIKQLSTKDLQDRLVEMQKEYIQLKATHSVSPIDNPAKITSDRKMIARVKTELRNRELNNK
jgi:large subunit ribosomal protein L29